MSLPRFSVPRRRLAAVSLAFALAVQLSVGAGTVAAAPADPAPARASHHADRAVELGAALERALAISGAPGLSLAVLAEDGRHWAGTAGVNQHGSALQIDEALAIGSVTKTFTAAIVLALVDEGRIQLDTRVNHYLPGVRLARRVTVRQLLNHTSGIDDLFAPLHARLDAAPDQALTSNEVLNSVGPRNFPSGSGYGYSNTNYYLLGHIIEVVTGHSFEDELAARFTGPLGLARTRMLNAADTIMPVSWSSAFWTSGAMVSTPTELAAWGRALYSGDLLSNAGMRRMLNFDGRPYGLGCQRLRVNDRFVPGHTGLLYDSTTYLLYLPAEQVTIALIGTEPNADLGAALAGRRGGRSVLEVIRLLAG